MIVDTTGTCTELKKVSIPAQRFIEDMRNQMFGKNTSLKNEELYEEGWNGPYTTKVRDLSPTEIEIYWNLNNLIHLLYTQQQENLFGNK